MFKKLFDRPAAISRQNNAPMVQERLAFLAHQSDRNMARNTLRSCANNLIAATNELKLAEQPDRIYTVKEVDAYARKWAACRAKPHQSKYGSPSAIRRFNSHTTQWLRYMGRLHQESPVREEYADEIDSFAAYMLNERGLSPGTITSQSWVASKFLCQLHEAGYTLSKITIVEVEGLLTSRMKASSYQRVSIRTFTSSVRSFFRYAETRGWCRTGIADAIKAARAFPQERLPSGPKWSDVQRLLATTEDEHPTNVRDRAILLLLATYGLRAGEVVNLCLEDFRWEQEVLSVRRSKSRDAQLYPLVQVVGDAVIRYIKDIRPKSSHREIFLTMTAPFRPMGTGSLWPVVANRLRALRIPLAHHGPHSLRHACATYLLSQGFSLKEIGDHLGHRSPEATRIYAKVDIVSLRKIAAFDLGGLQ